MNHRNQIKSKRAIALLLAAVPAIGVILTGCEKKDSGGQYDKLRERIQAAKEKDAAGPADEPVADTAADAVTDEIPAEPMQDPDAKADTEEADVLKEMLLKETGAGIDEVAVFAQEDYDGDGSEEAFALVGETIEDYPEMRTIEGNVWFVTKNGCELLHEGAAMGIYDDMRSMILGHTKYVLFDEVYATAILTYVWSVSNGKAVEAPFSAAGEVITDVPEGEDRFRIMDSSYDCSYYPDTDSWMGHTWKHYYFFYFDDIDEVCEYAGAYITQQTVLFLCGRDLVKELMPKGAKMDSLYCRGNGHIVINYELAGDDCVNYYHYIYNFLEGSFVDDTGEETKEEPLDGICKEALCPDIASYPEVPNPEN